VFIIISIVLLTASVPGVEYEKSEDGPGGIGELIAETLIGEGTTVEEEIPDSSFGYSPCDFLPDESAIPTEFLINDAVERNNSCFQSYRETSAFGTRFSVEIYSCTNKENCNNIYEQFVNDEKSRRGYTEIETIDGCFATKRDTTLDTIIKLYCNWEIVVFEEWINLGGGGDGQSLLIDIPQNVVDKVTKAINSY